jgi:hypothetical protein
VGKHSSVWLEAALRRNFMGSGRIKTVVAVALFAAALAALATRQYRNLLDPADPRSGNWGMADFRDVIYYPTVAVLEGDNPYDTKAYMAKYPVGNVFPLYTPHLLAIFLPFGLLPFAASGVLFWLLLVATYPLFSALCLKVCGIRPLVGRVFFLATAILISIPGRWAFDAGQLALLWAIGTLVAMQCSGTRPTLAGLGLTLAVCKPTFGVPLAVLLVFHRQYKAVLIGTGISALAGGISVGMIAAGAGWDSFWRTVDANQETLEAARPFDPSTSHTRVDANVFVQQVLGLPGGRWSELAVFASALLLAGAALRRARMVEPASAAGGLVLLAIIVCVYHQTYDAVLLTPIPLAIFTGVRGVWHDVPRPLRLAIALASAVPLVNVTWTKTFDSLLHRGLTVSQETLNQLAPVEAVVNSTVSLLAFVLILAAVWIVRRR